MWNGGLARQITAKDARVAAIPLSVQPAGHPNRTVVEPWVSLLVVAMGPGSFDERGRPHQLAAKGICQSQQLPPGSRG